VFISGTAHNLSAGESSISRGSVQLPGPISNALVNDAFYKHGRRERRIINSVLKIANGANNKTRIKHGSMS